MNSTPDYLIALAKDMGFDLITTADNLRDKENSTRAQ